MQWSDKIDKFIKENEENIVRDIAASVAVRSIQGEPAAGAPYGKGPKEALDVVLGIAKNMGMATNDGEGHVGWAELPGKESGYLATITHVDIVPEGDGWDADPLVLRNKDGWIIARGVADDKGPGILCLYAAKFLKDANVPLRYGLRVLFGCNEETGMMDVDYYLENQPAPLFCFSPDAEFSVCNGEKGLYDGTFSVPVGSGGRIIEFSGGSFTNVIPDKAMCIVKATMAELPGTNSIKTTDMGDGLIRLDATGISGHASKPKGTINAIGLLVNYLLEKNICTGDEKNALDMLCEVHKDTAGEAIGIGCVSEGFTPLTCIGGVISLEDGALHQKINIRYPTATTGEDITKTLTEFSEKYGGELVMVADSKPFYISPQSPAIEALLSAHRDVSGKDIAPFTMGGGTYARHFPNAVSYGPADASAERPSFVGSEHGANEGAYLPQFMLALKVYIEALIRLQEVDF